MHYIVFVHNIDLYNYNQLVLLTAYNKKTNNTLPTPIFIIRLHFLEKMAVMANWKLTIPVPLI
jgi:hypothetical protein